MTVPDRPTLQRPLPNALRSGTKPGAQTRLGATSLIRAFLALVFVRVVFREAFGHDTIAHIGAFNLTLTEPALALALLVIIRRFVEDRPVLSPLSLLTLSLAALQVLSLLRGLFIDPMAALITLRHFGIFISALVIVLCFPASDDFRIHARRYLLLAATILSVLALLRILISPTLLITRTAEFEGRPLLAQGTFVIAAGTVIALHQFIRTANPRAAALLLLMLVALATTGQVTAIVSAVIAMALVLAFSIGPAANARALLGALTIPALAAVYILAPQVFTLDHWISALPPLSDLLGTRQGTLELRRILWNAALVSYAGLDPLSQLIGIPAGTRMPVTFTHPGWGAVSWPHSLHSMYVQMLVSFGAFGAAAYIALLAAGLLRALARPVPRDMATDDGDKWLSLAIIAMCATMSFSYDLRAESGVILAFGLAALRPVTPAPQ